MAGAGAGAKIMDNGGALEPEPKKNNFGSATLQSRVKTIKAAMTDKS